MKSKASPKPQTVTKECWYYEYDNYIEIIYEIRIDGGYIRTDTIKIPKRKLEKSLERMNALSAFAETFLTMTGKLVYNDR